MTRSRWGPEGPPEEAYSRVTDPERFAPLHLAAEKLAERLAARFKVDRVDGYGFDPELEYGSLARPSVRLTPRNSASAPVVIAFSVFPGVRVRAGRWFRDAFPACGCDACDEAADAEAGRLAWLLEEVVVAGRLREAIDIPLFGDAWMSHSLDSPGRRSSGRGRLDRKRARAMLADGPTTYEWEPWPERP